MTVANKEATEHLKRAAVRNATCWPGREIGDKLWEISLLLRRESMESQFTIRRHLMLGPLNGEAKLPQAGSSEAKSTVHIRYTLP